MVMVPVRRRYRILESGNAFANEPTETLARFACLLSNVRMQYLRHIDNPSLLGPRDVFSPVIQVFDS